MKDDYNEADVLIHLISGEIKFAVSDVKTFENYFELRGN
jgi:hypothetical protein